MDLTIPPTLLARVDEVIETGLATSDMALFRRVGIAIERRLSGQKQTFGAAEFHNIRSAKFTRGFVALAFAKTFRCPQTIKPSNHGKRTQPSQGKAPQG